MKTIFSAMRSLSDWARGNKKTAVSAAIILAVAGYTFSVSPTVRGTVAAAWDCAHGEYMIHGSWFGLGNMCYPLTLQKRYGIDFDNHPDCGFGPDDIYYTNAYNRVSYSLIKRHFGRDVFAEVRSVCAEKKTAAQSGYSR